MNDMTTTEIIITALCVLGQFVVVGWLHTVHVVRPRRAARKAAN